MKFEDIHVEVQETVKVTECEVVETVSAESAEAAEQQLMDAAAEQPVGEAEELEQREMDEAVGKLGYSSDYYEHEMARALEKGNRIAYDNAKRDWAKAKAKEATH